MGKMKIDRTNYEEFIIGYLDKTLDPVKTAELLLFLEQNPDLKEEASELASISLKPDSGVVYNFKDALIQPADVDAIHLNTSNYNHYFIAALEGDLSASGHKAIENFISRNPVLKKEYELFKLTRLKADPAIRYPEPRLLKKPVAGGFMRIIYFSAAAAAILILISFYLRPESQQIINVAENIKGKEKPAAQATVRDSVQVKTTSVRPSQKINVNSGNPAPKTGIKATVKAGIVPPENKKREQGEISPVPSRHFINHTPEPFNGGSRNFYSSLFDEIRKSQEAMLAGLEPEVATTNSLPLARTKTVKRINSLIRSGAQIVSLVPESINGWMLADLGIEGINMLTDNDIKLQRVAKPDGHTEKVIITEEGSGYSFSRKPY
ncbi:MAG: hypothetical protein FD166_1885 [Bacteroidetes bacterium]|nr:MAG: hypothetical protein FD166_1885 [Bacteroidota bacterium]